MSKTEPARIAAILRPQVRELLAALPAEAGCYLTPGRLRGLLPALAECTSRDLAAALRLLSADLMGCVVYLPRGAADPIAVEAPPAAPGRPPTPTPTRVRDLVRVVTSRGTLGASVSEAAHALRMAPRHVRAAMRTAEAEGRIAVAYTLASRGALLAARMWPAELPPEARRPPETARSAPWLALSTSARAEYDAVQMAGPEYAATHRERVARVLAALPPDGARVLLHFSELCDLSGLAPGPEGGALLAALHALGCAEAVPGGGTRDPAWLFSRPAGPPTQ